MPRKPVCVIYDPASQVYESNVFPDGFVHRDKVPPFMKMPDPTFIFIREKGSHVYTTLTMDRFGTYRLFYAS
jgi:hypothetical protein